MPYVCVVDVLETNALCVCCICSRRRMPDVCAVDVLEDERLMCVLWMF